MIFLISAAMADSAASSQSSSGFMSLVPMLFFIGIIYFLLIRPQQKRAKLHQELISSIKKGDKVVTNSGIIGTVTKILNEQEVLIEVADKVFVKFVKSTISSVVNASTPINPVASSTGPKNTTPIASSSESAAKTPIESSASANKPAGKAISTTPKTKETSKVTKTAATEDKPKKTTTTKKYYPKKKTASQSENVK